MTLSFVIRWIVASSSTSALVLAAILSPNSVCCCQEGRPARTTRSQHASFLPIQIDDGAPEKATGFAAVRRVSGWGNNDLDTSSAFVGVCLRAAVSLGLDKLKQVRGTAVHLPDSACYWCACYHHLHMNAVQGPEEGQLEVLVTT
jgi:hypothetical protein